MRALVGLFVVVGSLGVARAEPPRPVIAGATLGYGALDPGDNGYLPSALTGPHASVYLGRPLTPELAVVVGGWLLRGDAEHAAWAYGGDLGLRYLYAPQASVTARGGVGHVEWSDSDGGYLDEGALSVGLDAGFELLREPWGAVTAQGGLTRVVIEDGYGAQMIYAVSFGYAY